ncbi:TIGR01906 family membrane protein [Chloroflexota bacterium]
MQKIEQSPLIHILKWAIVINIPIWLTLMGIRLVATETFLHLEYNRSNFPADFFGFTEEERLTYAPFALQYMSNDQGIDFLGDLEFPDGSAMYNDRELHHMVDVKNVAIFAFGLQVVLTLFLVIGVGLLLCFMTTRKILRQALIYGSSLTLLIIFALLLVSITSWEYFFEQFHRMFFADGTWRFEYSDTLIRLFPEQFWFDAALAIGIFTAVGAASILIVAGLWEYKTKTAATQEQSAATVSEIE